MPGRVPRARLPPRERAARRRWRRRWRQPRRRAPRAAAPRCSMLSRRSMSRGPAMVSWDCGRRMTLLRCPSACSRCRRRAASRGRGVGWIARRRRAAESRCAWAHGPSRRSQTRCSTTLSTACGRCAGTWLRRSGAAFPARGRPLLRGVARCTHWAPPTYLSVKGTVSCGAGWRLSVPSTLDTEGACATHAAQMHRNRTRLRPVQAQSRPARRASRAFTSSAHGTSIGGQVDIGRHSL